MNHERLLKNNEFLIGGLVIELMLITRTPIDYLRRLCSGSDSTETIGLMNEWYLY